MAGGRGIWHTSWVPRRWANIVCAVAMLLLGGAWEPFRSPNAAVEAGNQAYSEGRYGDAVKAYDQAEQQGVDRAGLAYNRGAALLKQAEGDQTPARVEMLERAAAELRKAESSTDSRVRSAASYNRGNALMGLQRLDDAIIQEGDERFQRLEVRHDLTRQPG